MGREEQGLAKSQERYKVIPRTLCFIYYGEEVLLLRGAPDKRLWAGQLNGIGGHVEPGEDIRSAAWREIHEETGLQVKALRLRGVVHIDAGDPTLGIVLFVFTAEAAQREVRPSSEGELTWVPIQALPNARMVPDLPALLERIIAMQPGDPPFTALYSYDENDRLVISFSAP